MPYNPGSEFNISSGYGRRNDADNHTGVDYAAANGTDVPAAAEGQVWYVRKGHPTYGNVIILKHTGADGSNYYTLYAHLKRVENFLLDQVVDAGTTLGTVGRTGNARGDHLHFEVIDTSRELTHEINSKDRIGLERDTDRITQPILPTGRSRVCTMEVNQRRMSKMPKEWSCSTGCWTVIPKRQKIRQKENICSTWKKNAGETPATLPNAVKRW